MLSLENVGNIGIENRAAQSHGIGAKRMITVTAVDILEYRAELGGDAGAIKALDMLEDCEGNLEDAAISLAIQAGHEPDASDQWLDGFVKRWRAKICQPGLRDTLEEAETLADWLRSLSGVTDLPSPLVTIIAIYVSKTGLEPFCQPMDEKL